jgi:hypothetical protein
MYEYDSGTVLVITISPPTLYQAKGVDTGVQAEDLFYPTHLPTLELFSGYGTPFFPRRVASAHMAKSLALDPHDPSSRGDLLPSRDGIPPRVASIIWNRNFPSLCLIHLHIKKTSAGSAHRSIHVHDTAVPY